MGSIKEAASVRPLIVNYQRRFGMSCCASPQRPERFRWSPIRPSFCIFYFFTYRGTCQYYWPCCPQCCVWWLEMLLAQANWLGFFFNFYRDSRSRSLIGPPVFSRFLFFAYHNLGSVRFGVQKRSGGECLVYLATFQSEAPPDRQARQIRTQYRI